MRIFLRQLCRGFLALIIGILVFAFVLLSAVTPYLTGTAAYAPIFSDKAFIADQKAYVDEAIDALAKRNRFDGEPVKQAITAEALIDYNLQIVLWWQNAAQTGVWGEAPVLSADMLKPAFDVQENLDERKKAISITSTQKKLDETVFDASHGFLSKVMESVPTAKYLKWVPYLKIALIAAFAACLTLLLLSLARQFSLMLWFTGLSAFLAGGLLFALSTLVRLLPISQTLLGYSKSFGASVNGMLNMLLETLSAAGLAGITGGAALLIAYFIVFRSIQRFKQIVNA